MEAAITAFLDGLTATVFRAAFVGFLVVNGAALAAFLATRSRRFVDTWTPRLVAIDTVLLGAGLGVPLLAYGAKFGVHAVATLATGALRLFK